MTVDQINRNFLIDNYLFGIPLEDIYGTKMNDSLVDHYINAAIQYAERTFQICINTVDIVNEVHDYYAGDFENWGFLQVYKRPILSVTSMSMYFGPNKMMDIPTDWIRVYETPGQIQLFPVSGSSGSLILTQTGSFLPYTLGLYKNAPGMWRLSYKAGITDVPQDLVEYIMKRASVGILQVWGDLIIGAGIANQTISIDGLSQSIGTTQSPEFSGAGARIKNYQDDMKILESRLRDTYLGINVVVV